MKEDDLEACDWQYTVRHTDVNCFDQGEKVFLKSNPEHQMIVHSVNKGTITTIWHTKSNKAQTYKFYPECILQYKYAGLLTYRKKLCVSLN
jgi:hypothetical protein